MNIYVAYVLILLGSGIAVTNWSIPYSFFKKKKVPSTVWFIGGILLAIGFIGLNRSLSNFWWIAFLIDFGSVPALFFYAYLVANAKARKK
jgi:hypothetical protein